MNETEETESKSGGTSEAGSYDPRALVLDAFQMARDRGKSNWRRMTLAVLKNRMIDLSRERSREEFHESRYGFSSFKEFVGSLRDLVRFDGPEIELIEQEPDTSGIEARGAVHEGGGAEGERVRPDKRKP